MLLQWYPYSCKEIGFQIIQINPDCWLASLDGEGVRIMFRHPCLAAVITICPCIPPIISPRRSWHHLITSVILKTILTFCCPWSYWLGNDCLVVQWYHPSNYRCSQHQRSQHPEVWWEPGPDRDWFVSAIISAGLTGHEGIFLINMTFMK